MRLLTLLAILFGSMTSFASDSLPVLAPGYYGGQDYRTMARCYIKVEKHDGGIWVKINQSVAALNAQPKIEEKIYQAALPTALLAGAFLNIQVAEDGGVSSFTVVNHPAEGENSLCLISR